MILGSKPLRDLSEDELRAAIAELQASREALRAEAIAKKERNETVPRAAKPKAPKAQSDASKINADMWASLTGEDK